MTESNVQPFEFEGNKMRTSQDKNGNPLFCAKDAAIILGYTNPNKAIRDHTRGERIVPPSIKTTDQPGGASRFPTPLSGAFCFRTYPPFSYGKFRN